MAPGGNQHGIHSQRGGRTEYRTDIGEVRHVFQDGNARCVFKQGGNVGQGGPVKSGKGTTRAFVAGKLENLLVRANEQGSGWCGSVDAGKQFFARRRPALIG